MVSNDVGGQVDVQVFFRTCPFRGKYLSSFVPTDKCFEVSGQN